MRRKRIVKQIGCAVLAGALMVGQIFGSEASLITAKAAESWVDTLKVAMVILKQVTAVTGL